MSISKKNPLKRDQALNDATSGQMGEEPRSVAESSEEKESRVKAARRLSKEIE
jgi:hypothetical protein